MIQDIEAPPAPKARGKVQFAIGVYDRDAAIFGRPDLSLLYLCQDGRWESPDGAGRLPRDVARFDRILEAGEWGRVFWPGGTGDDGCPLGPDGQSLTLVVKDLAT